MSPYTDQAAISAAVTSWSGLYRPGWAGKHMRLVVYALFWDTDATFKVTDISYEQRN